MSEFTYPDRLEITPLSKPVASSVTVPGSKSITNRALVLAALASNTGPCRLTGALQSEDTELMVACLRALGHVLEGDWDAGSPEIRVAARYPDTCCTPAGSAELFVGNSGTTVRFLAAAVSLGNGRYRLDGVPRMRERPIQDLLDALGELGVRAYSELGNGCPPIVIEGRGGGQWSRQVVEVRGGTSSQYLSGLLMAGPYGCQDLLTVKVVGELVSEPYVRMTVDMMRQWGLDVKADQPGEYTVFATNQALTSPQNPAHYAIEPDASAASYFWAAASITGGRVTVNGLTRKSLQGDVAFVDVLERMGCRVEECEVGITIHGGPLRGTDVDMNAISDTVMTLAAVACFAEGPTTIRNVGHIRHKETDRIAALATELRKLGAEVEEFADGLMITPRPLTGCAVDTYNDHRMAMSLALVGLRVPGVVINDPGCVAKTYPGFWQDLERLRA